MRVLALCMDYWEKESLKEVIEAFACVVFDVQELTRNLSTNLIAIAQGV